VVAPDGLLDYIVFGSIINKRNKASRRFQMRFSEAPGLIVLVPGCNSPADRVTVFPAAVNNKTYNSLTGRRACGGAVRSI